VRLPSGLPARADELLPTLRPSYSRPHFEGADDAGGLPSDWASLRSIMPSSVGRPTCESSLPSSSVAAPGSPRSLPLARTPAVIALGQGRRSSPLATDLMDCLSCPLHPVWRPGLTPSLSTTSATSTSRRGSTARPHCTWRCASPMASCGRTSVRAEAPSDWLAPSRTLCGQRRRADTSCL
jgi:hypothetical protein